MGDSDRNCASGHMLYIRSPAYLNPLKTQPSRLAVSPVVVDMHCHTTRQHSWRDSVFDDVLAPPYNLRCRASYVFGHTQHDAGHIGSRQSSSGF